LIAVQRSGAYLSLFFELARLTGMREMMLSRAGFAENPGWVTQTNASDQVPL
jgi:hypothetical protein